MHVNADEKASESSAGSKDGLHEEAALEPHVSHLDDDPLYSYKEQRAIIHRIDRRLVVTCGLIYCFSLIDRGNLGNASIAGSVLPLSAGQSSCQTDSPLHLA